MNKIFFILFCFSLIGCNDNLQKKVFGDHIMTVPCGQKVLEADYDSKWGEYRLLTRAMRDNEQPEEYRYGDSVVIVECKK